MALLGHCARCEAVVPVVDGEPAAFCVQCGLPQLRVSESVLEAAELEESAGSGADADGAAGGNAAGARPPQVAMTGELDWPVMLRILMVATVVGVLPAVLLRDLLFSGALGMASLLMLPLLGMASAGAYLRWRPQTRMTAGAGAQMGVALGTMLAFAESAVTGIASFALRFGRHDRSLETNFNAVMQQATAQVKATQPDAPAGLFAAMQTPEWHAGWFLVMEGALMLLLVVAGAVVGLMVGGLLGARQRVGRAG